MDVGIGIPPFKSLDTDPGGTLKRFKEYVDQMKLLHQLVFRKSDGTPYDPTDSEKKALMLLKGGKDMKNLYDHVGKVLAADTFDNAVTKITDGLSSRTNQVVQRNMLFTRFPQSSKSFKQWHQEISEAAKLISYTGYNWEQAAVDAILLQTSNPKLRERALQENMTYDDLVKLGITKEQSAKGAALLEKASGQSPLEEEVRRLTFENRKLKKAKKKNKGKWNNQCGRCGSTSCEKDTKCKAYGKQCIRCKKMNHLAQMCRTKPRQEEDCGQLSSEES